MRKISQARGDRVNRINYYCKNALANYLMCKYIYLNFQEPYTEMMYEKSTKEAHIWCAIRKTIRKGYKRGIE